MSERDEFEAAWNEWKANEDAHGGFVSFKDFTAGYRAARAPQAVPALYPIRYVLTDADHMAATFDALEAALNERDAAVLEREESDGDDSPERLERAAESIADLTYSMRRAIHEYRKRAERYRASVAAPQPSPEPEKAEKLLLAACRRAAMALAHASERMPQYNADYQAVSDAIAAYVAAEPKEPR